MVRLLDMIAAWDWREGLENEQELISLVLFFFFFSSFGRESFLQPAYHGGSGSLWLMLFVSEASD